MSLKATLFAVMFLGVFTLFAQIPPNISQIRQQIREFEKQRFQQQLPLLHKVTTPNQNQFDITSYRLNLDLYPTTEILYGEVTISGFSRVNGLDHLEIDLFDNMSVDSVFQDGQMVTHTHGGNIINIPLLTPLNQGETFSVIVFYHGNPQSGGLGTWGWDYHQGQPIIWTLSEPYGAPAWWPCKDSPADKADSVFLEVTVPNDLIVASNGLLTDVIPVGNNRHTFFWETHYPISTYLVSLAITNYAQFSDTYTSPLSGDTMSVDFYVYPEHLAQAQEDFNVTTSMIAAYASRFGEYPFINEKYGMAVFPWGGAMEHQTMTSYGAGLITGTHTFDWINAHELSHQWFGDMITMKSWHHIWLNEGFASYAEALWAEEIGGSTLYHAYVDAQDPGYFPGTVYVQDTTNTNELFSTTVYNKGSWVLHMLRGVLGDSLFFTSLYNYANDPGFQYGNATTEDFRDVCEMVSGMDLDWFFEQWVYRPGRPHYLYSWNTTTSPPYITTLSIMQQDSVPFKMPIPIHLTGLGLDTTIIVWDSLQTQEFQFTTDVPPADLEFDPQNWILKYVTEGSLISVSGQVIDVADSTGIPGAVVFWEGPYDTVMGFPASSGQQFTDANGNFSLSLPPGVFALIGLHPNYLQSEFLFLDLQQDTSGIILALSQPLPQFSLDSLSVSLTGGEHLDTSITIQNIGSGNLFVQAVEGDASGPSVSFSPSTVLMSQLPSRDSFLAPPTQQVLVPPIDSLWQHLHHDQQEHPGNPYDLKDTYVQKNAGLYYLKFTTYGQPATYTPLRINIFLDTDVDPSTGAPFWSVGADYLIAVLDAGFGYYGYLLQWNESTHNFDFVAAADYFDANPGEKSITIGFDGNFLGNPSYTGILVDAFKTADLSGTIDYIPSSNAGHLTAFFDDIPWISIQPLFDLANNDSSAILHISLDPGNLPSGSYQSAFTFFTTQIGYMDRTLLPIHLDVVSDISEHPTPIPETFEVSQNYPNPFNPETHIRYGLPEPAKVTIDIFNILGQRVYHHQTALLPAGFHTFIWKGRSDQGHPLSSGVYFYQISDGKHSIIRKMVLMK